MRRISSSVTIREPNAIDPSEKVDARSKAESVGWLGYRPVLERVGYSLIPRINLPLGHRSLVQNSTKLSRCIISTFLYIYFYIELLYTSVWATSKSCKCDIPNHLGSPEIAKDFVCNESANFRRRARCSSIACFEVGLHIRYTLNMDEGLEYVHGLPGVYFAYLYISG